MKKLELRQEAVKGRYDEIVEMMQNGRMKTVPGWMIEERLDLREELTELVLLIEMLRSKK